LLPDISREGEFTKHHTQHVQKRKSSLIQCCFFDVRVFHAASERRVDFDFSFCKTRGPVIASPTLINADAQIAEPSSFCSVALTRWLRSHLCQARFAAVEQLQVSALEPGRPNKPTSMQALQPSTFGRCSTSVSTPGTISVSPARQHQCSRRRRACCVQTKAQKSQVHLAAFKSQTARPVYLMTTVVDHIADISLL